MEAVEVGYVLGGIVAAGLLVAAARVPVPEPLPHPFVRALIISGVVASLLAVMFAIRGQGIPLVGALLATVALATVVVRSRRAEVHDGD